MGVVHPDYLLDQLDSRQIAEWIAFSRLEPFGERMADIRAGQVCATVANYAGKMRSSDAPLAHPGDFMPSLAGAKRPEANAPTLLADPVAQAVLMRKVLFRKDD